MSDRTRPYAFGLVLLCLLTVSLPTRADSVTVSGYGYFGGNALGLGASAGIFFAESAWPDGPSNLGLGLVGVPMTLSFSVIPFSGPGYTFVTVGSQSTDILTGGIDFATGTFTVPASAVLAGTFTTSVSVLGQLMAFSDLTGEEIASLTFAGTGTVTLQLSADGENSFLIVLAGAQFDNISGTLTTVPEIPSLLMVGTGMAFVGTIARRNLGFLLRAGQRFPGRGV